MKKMWRHTLLGTMAIAVLVAMPFASALAQKTTPATDKKTDMPAVPRAIPDLIPYHKWDPPKSKLFDINKLTLSGDIRVRPEYRNNANFGVGGATGTQATGANRFFVQQWVRMGFNYDISPDVSFFAQPQWSKNWGASNGGQFATGQDTFPATAAGNNDPNSTDANLFMRQAFMLIRNFGVQNLSLKAGRQLQVWGNHRLFGHFDWNNVGWAFDGATMRYNHAEYPVELGWLRIAENNCASSTAGGCGKGTKANNDSDIIFARMPLKVAGMAIEPTYIWETGGTGVGTAAGAQAGTGPSNGISIARPDNQSRHTLGGRMAAARIGGMLDFTVEGYYQTGEVGNRNATRNVNINAFAAHADGGVTLFDTGWQPRFGVEFNVASGDGAGDTCGRTAGSNFGCGSNQNTFSQLFPTNHIHFGYMDQQAWKNMYHLSGSIQSRPTKASHLEVSHHGFWRYNDDDHWYNASQNVNIFDTGGTTGFNGRDNDATFVGHEFNAVYTLFFQGNHVAWQLGYGHFFPGSFINKSRRDSAAFAGSPSGQDWGYTQLWINF